MKKIRKAWFDEEMDLIFTLIPTKKNAQVLAKALGRTRGSIVAAWSHSRRAKTNNVFVEQLRRARKRAGWVY